MNPRARLFPSARALAALPLVAVLAFAALPAHADDDDAAEALIPAFTNDVEAALVRAITGLRENGLQHALGEIDLALAKTPNFRLGHLIRGDLLMARAGFPVAFGPGASVTASTAPFQDEARVRLKRYLEAPPADYLPRPVMQMASGQAHMILVDTQRSRLFVFANEAGKPRYVTDFYISLGKNGVDKTREGDQKTPIGVYTIVSAKEKLPDFYGNTAFPISYPNEWDRANGRNGHGIWLHGTPSATYSRPPRATDGCVVLTNDDLERLSRYVSIGRTPVVISHAVEWQEPRAWAAGRDAFSSAFEKWRADWESLDVERYLSHYSPRFAVDGKNIAAWSAQKRKVNAGKSWIKVGVANASFYSFPDAEDMVAVTFEQDYRSSNLSNRTTKRQYWVLEQGRWHIVYETVVS